MTFGLYLDLWLGVCDGLWLLLRFWAESAISGDEFLDHLQTSSSKTLAISLEESGSAVSVMVDLSMVDANCSQESESDVRSIMENSDVVSISPWLESCCW